MKKTLVTLLLTILMSAGILFSATSVSAEAIPLGYSVAKNNDSGLIVLDYDNLEKAIIEYSFYSNGILMSQLLEKDLNYVSSESGMYTYTFSLPEDALSFKVWRVITSDDQIKSLSGSFEYVYTPETAISEVETRLKTLYIYDDLITKELAPISYGGTATFSYIFNMHFNVVDALGETIPIDRIHSLSVEFDTIKRTLFWDNTTHHEKYIVATEERNMTVWPFISPASVKTYIKESIDSNYDWMVELASIASADPFGVVQDVTLDQTTILTISYYYNDVFYQDEEVTDEPYDYQDIITVFPGTTEPFPGWFELLGDIGSLSKWIQVGVYIALGLVAILIIMVIMRLFSILKFVVQLIIGSIKILFKVLKFMFISIPKGIMNLIIFLIVPRDKRKERSNVSRYL